ncbi:MAG TPA: MauE/DoxX family redox-associated membrane protein, partial [Terriglobales bacterium]|nr:MauE/DoxX family redox-associated membrane protein [Terriglobales bacterium]
MSLDPAVALTVRYGLTLLLAAAATHKLAQPALFRATVAEYQLLPPAWVAVAASLIVAAEVALLLLLLTGSTPRLTSFGLVLILALYSSAIAVNLARGRSAIACGCIGGASAALSSALLWRNLGFAVAALMLQLPEQDRPLVWLDWLTVTA